MKRMSNGFVFWGIAIVAMILPNCGNASVQPIKKPQSAEVAAALERHRNMTPEERAEMRRRGKEKALKLNGGYIDVTSTGKVVRVVNRQKILPAEDVRRIVTDVRNIVRVEIEVVSEIKHDGRMAAKIELIEDPKAPTLLVAPEDVFGNLNVYRLAVDSPDRQLLRRRFTKEFWRIFGMTLGAFNSNYSPCVMRNIFSLADLDGDNSLVPSPEVYDKIQETSRSLGIDTPHRITYRRACIEGWAPPPTNDVQKAIWEKVKADKERGPTNPITIPPPKAKAK